MLQVTAPVLLVQLVSRVSRGHCDFLYSLTHVAAMQSLFAIFMGRSKLKHHKADSMTVAEEEQRVVSVITNLLTVHVFWWHGRLAWCGCNRVWGLLAMLHS